MMVLRLERSRDESYVVIFFTSFTCRHVIGFSQSPHYFLYRLRADQVDKLETIDETQTAIKQPRSTPHALISSAYNDVRN